MKKISLILSFSILACAPSPKPDSPPDQDGSVRTPVDTTGYTHTREGIERVVENATRLEQQGLDAVQESVGLDAGSRFVAAISPHDDYIYASRAYVHVYPYIKAKHVILVGVAHKARDFPHVENKLVFDTFNAWQGPYGAVPVSPIRDALSEALGSDGVVGDDLAHIEHSVEGMIPFLQHYNRDVQIVPVLVPYMSFERLTELADKAADALDEIMEKRGLKLGEDVAILVSSDSVHYGDEGWGGKNFADFGVDQAGYDKAVERDQRFVSDYLVGEVTPGKLSSLYSELLMDDPHEYRVTWCGRFSIPFGLALLHNLVENDGSKPKGHLLKYATTLDPGAEDPGVPGLSVTAPATLRHWVGFVSVGFF